MRVLLTLRFLGSSYNGLQRQENTKNTIQEKIENAIKKIYNKDIKIEVGSRLDKGVHARDFKAHMDVDEKLPAKKIPIALNRFLPLDIRVKSAHIVSDKFHARYDSIDKTYVYKIYVDRVIDPFLDIDYLQLYNMPDLKLLHEVFSKIKGKHDFSAFMNYNTDVKNTVRKVKDLRLELNENKLYIKIKADGFLYNMARIIVGVALDISFGKLTLDDLDKMLEKQIKPNNFTVAKSKGLTLIETKY